MWILEKLINVMSWIPGLNMLTDRMRHLKLKLGACYPVSYYSVGHDNGEKLLVVCICKSYHKL